MQKNLISFCDFPKRWQTGFQDPATPVMEGIIDLHHSIFFFLIVILITVLFLFVQTFEVFLIPVYPVLKKLELYIRIVLLKNYPNYLSLGYVFKIKSVKYNYISLLKKLIFVKHHINFNYDTLIEIIWTIIPSIILIFIAIPSFMLLYSIDEIVYPQITIKVIGHQWFWSYESYDLFESNLKTIYQYDSYMTPTDEINDGKLRLLDVDLPLYLPTRTHIRILITSSDVLHSWAVPSLGVKMDAVPGRLNQISLFIKRKGV
jgi:cytochrome c oxidase subunit 2